MSLVVRSWNVYHGNAKPPRRRAFLREMVELVTADRPALVCLQEVPVWALAHLARWSGLRAVGVVAARPRLRSAQLGRRITGLNHGLLRSAVSGQANAILADGAIGEVGTLIVSAGGERRVCHSVRFDDISVVNFHVTGGRPASEQLGRVVDFALEQGERCVLAGDANLPPGDDPAYRRLRDEGFSAPLAGSIDQIVVRGLPASPPVAWPEERRRRGSVLLSDHAPIELTVG